MDDTNNAGGRVGKLLARRPWKKQASRESFGSAVGSDERPRGRSPHSTQVGADDGGEEEEAQRRGSQSRPWADGHYAVNDDDAEFLQLDASPAPYYEAETESSLLRPTVPSTHPSQIGHLTTSSPIIQADHAPEVQNLDTLANDSRESSRSRSFSRSATYSVAVSSDSLGTNTSESSPRRLSTSKTGLLPPSSQSSGRSRSPAGRFKGVFRTKRNSSASPSVSSQKSDQSDTTTHEAEADVDVAAERSNHNTPFTPSDLNEPDIASSEKPHRRKGTTPGDILVPPRTPPSGDQAAPAIVSTPPTPPGRTHVRQGSRARAGSTDLPSVPNITVSPSGNSISHRRMRSGSGTSIGPSKLSNFTLAPLTPTPENGPPPTPSGFFSSMISAAQNAANTFNTNPNSNSNGGGSKHKNTPIPELSREGDGDTIEVESSTDLSGERTMGEPAVKTLGQGDLSLEQLGIQEPNNNLPTAQGPKFPDQVNESRSRSDSAPAEPFNGPFDDPVSRPRSLYDSAALSDRSPPGSVFDGKTGVTRSSSIRSAIGRRRKRGSTSGTANTTGTGNTIGAAIAAANASVAHPQAAGSVPKLTGFAVASKKRNRDFHALFKSVPDDDYLIEDYSCALQREILAHGRLYVSEGHLCFSSNIFGWVTTLVMSFDEIVSVEKRSTALLFKNGLMISTLHAKHVFASFTSRDSTYDLIVNIWKLGHPTLRSSLNGVSIDETGGDKTEKVDDLEAPVDNSGSGSEIADDDEESVSGDDVYDEDDEDDDAGEATQPTEMSPIDTDGEKAGGRKVSGALATNGALAKPQDGATAPAGEKDYPGPAAHAPTDCGDAASHFDKFLADEVIAAPLGKVYNLVFGPASVNFMAKWLTGEQKCTDLQMEDKIGLTQDNKSRAFTYIKPLNASIGPKQTKCVVTESLESIDLEKSVNVLVAVQNPDVPSGNVFSVKTRYCLSWAENNGTRIQVNCTIEWTGKSWLKGPIEKGANDGQTQYCKDLFASIKAAVTSRPRAALANGAGGKGKKRKGKGKSAEASSESPAGAKTSAAAKKADWGPLEPLHDILGPVIDILAPILTGNVVYGLLVGLLVASWFGFGFNLRQPGPGYGHSISFLSHPDRIVAYEEIWRREEADLWNWLEERVGLHRMGEGAPPMRKRVVEPRTFEEKMREDRMNEREIEEAIRVTEEKLHVLKEVHDRKKVDARGPVGKVYVQPTQSADET